MSKKQAGPSKKGKEAAHPKKRRSGASGLRVEDQEPQEPDFPSLHFISAEAQQLMEERYAHKKVLNGRVLDKEFFEDFPMMEWFRIQGWIRLLSKKFSVYPTLVMMFYANLVAEEDRGEFILNCYVKGKHFTLTADAINSILGIRALTQETRNSMTPAAAKIELLGRYASKKTPKVKYLDVDTRLVMLVVAWMIKPVSGHMTSLTDAVAKIVYDIKHGLYVNLGRIMVDHMQGIKQLKGSNMPYGMWLTPILQHMGVDLTGELETKLQIHKVCLGEQTMIKLGLERDRDGEWRRKHNRRVAMSDEEEQEEEEEEEGRGAECESQPIPEAIEPGMRTSSSGGYTSYTERFNNLEEEVRAIRRSQDVYYQAMDAKMDNVNQNVTDMRGEWASFNEFMRDYVSQNPSGFPPPPPSDEA